MDETLRYLLIFLVLLFANGIQAITGFAGTLLATPPSIHLMGAEDARTVLNLLAQASCFLILLQSWREVVWRALGRMLALMLVGMAAGVALYRALPLDFLLVVYGVFILLVAVQKLCFPRLWQGKSPLWVVPLAGVIHGMFVSGGALLVVYASAALPKKETFRATMAAVWFVLGFFFTGTQLAGGAVTAGAWQLTAFGLVPLLLGTWAGGRLLPHISQDAFLKLTYLLLAVSGVLAIL